MAVIFELVVNFGVDEHAAQRAASLVAAAPPTQVGNLTIPLGSPLITRIASPRPYIEFSVHPPGLGTAVGDRDAGFDHRSLTTEDVSNLGAALYDLLRRMNGYRAAIVGWNPEPLVDIYDLEQDVTSGEPPQYDGLVLANDQCERWNLGHAWQPFAEGYRWLPYAGERRVWWTGSP